MDDEECEEKKLELFIENNLVPIKELKTFTKIFILGEQTDLAFLRDPFLNKRKEGQDFECYRFTAATASNGTTTFCLVILAEEHRCPKNYLSDDLPNYCYKSISREEVFCYSEYDKQSFVSDFLCKELGLELMAFESPTSHEQQQELLHNTKKINKKEQEKEEIREIEVLNEIVEEKLIQENEQVQMLVDQKIEEKIREKSAEKNTEIEELKNEISDQIKQKSAEKQMEINLLRTHFEEKSSEIEEQIKQKSAEKGDEINQLREEMKFFIIQNKSLAEKIEEADSRENSAERKISQLCEETKERSDEKQRQIDLLKNESEEKNLEINLLKTKFQEEKLELEEKFMAQNENLLSEIKANSNKIVEALNCEAFNIKVSNFESNVSNEGFYARKKIKLATEEIINTLFENITSTT